MSMSLQFPNCIGPSTLWKKMVSDDGGGGCDIYDQKWFEKCCLLYISFGKFTLLLYTY